MSNTFSLVCHETRQRVWIGQGWGMMTTLYSGEQQAMDDLREFLNLTAGKPLQFICDDVASDDVFGYERVSSRTMPPIPAIDGPTISTHEEH
jgi:hypothetical protein